MGMRTVISASRRTDIPAFYADWLLERVREGFVEAPNPVVRGQTHRVSLSPDDVHTIVLWSKNFAPLLPKMEVLTEYRLYFLFTVNDCDLLEPCVPLLEERLAQAEELAGRFGPERIGWRFDPVMLWNEGRGDNLGSFERIAEFMGGIGVPRCIFSFCHYYRKVRQRLDRARIAYHEPSLETKVAITERLVRGCERNGLALYSCCSDEILHVPGVRKSSCIDGELLSRLAGELASKARDTGQRVNCGCAKSRDIGDYRMTCRHRCVYCYAMP